MTSLTQEIFVPAPRFAHLNPDEDLGEGISSVIGRDEWNALVETARASDMIAVAQAHGAQLRRSGHGGEFVGACPVCGTGHDRFAINPKKGLFNCRVCGKGGHGPIDLEMFLGGCEFVEAVKRLTSTTSLSVPRLSRAKVVEPARKGEHDAGAANKLKQAERIWQQSLDIAGTAGEAYLARRGIVLEGVPNFGGLRWHPNCPWEGGTAPCVLARFTDAIAGAPRGIWRRPINRAKPKTLGPMGGCVIRLWPDEDVIMALVLGEGVETVLTAATRFTHRNILLQPAWAAASASNLENLPVLAGIEALTLLVDHDENGIGQKAARGCGKRWRAADREVKLLMPNKLGADFNDLVRP
jgi:hypothetical protein